MNKKYNMNTETKVIIKNSENAKKFAEFLLKSDYMITMFRNPEISTKSRTTPETFTFIIKSKDTKGE